MDLQKAIEKRASIRKYSDKKVNPENILEAIEAANLAPSPGNTSILKFIIVENEELKETIAEYCNQDFVKTAQFIVVVCSDPLAVERLYDVRAEKYIKQHAGAAIENFLLKITSMGLACCWIGAFMEDSLKIHLKIPPTNNIEAILPVSYQLVSDKTVQKKKHPLNRKIFFEEWGNKYGKSFEKVRRDDV